MSEDSTFTGSCEHCIDWSEASKPFNNHPLAIGIRGVLAAILFLLWALIGVLLNRPILTAICSITGTAFFLFAVVYYLCYLRNKAHHDNTKHYHFLDQSGQPHAHKTFPYQDQKNFYWQGSVSSDVHLAITQRQIFSPIIETVLDDTLRNNFTIYNSPPDNSWIVARRHGSLIEIRSPQHARSKLIMPIGKALQTMFKFRDVSSLLGSAHEANDRLDALKLNWSQRMIAVHMIRTIVGYIKASKAKTQSNHGRFAREALEFLLTLMPGAVKELDKHLKDIAPADKYSMEEFYSIDAFLLRLEDSLFTPKPKAPSIAATAAALGPKRPPTPIE
jgi:hypothetical protein